MAGRRPIVAANWKMHKTHLEAIQAVQKLSYLLDAADAERVEVVICPAFTALRSVQTLLDADRLAFLLGAQNVHWEEKGAFTGEVSPGMLAALKCRYVIVGHSERRQLFGETDEMVARKVRAVFGAEMIPIVCVGESLEDRDAGRTDEKVVGQVRAAVSSLPPEQAATLVVAYEPIWAIGTGRNASPEDAGQVIRADPGDRGKRGRARGGGGRAHPVRRKRQGRRTSATSWPTPRSTARWSAARAWIRRSSRSS